MAHTEPEHLSPKQRAIVEAVASGKSMRAVARDVGLSHTRVQRIVHGPAGAKYLAQLNRQGRDRIYTRTLAEIEARLDYGGLAVPLRDLIALLKVLEPQEIKLLDSDMEQEAERIIAERGMTGDAAERLRQAARDRDKFAKRRTA